MKVQLSSASPSQVETEVLIVPVLDHGEKDKNEARPAAGDDAIQNAAKDLASGNEITGKSHETLLFHRPHGLKAKRLLFVGGGKAKKFGTAEVRKQAGAAVRFLKSKNFKRFAILAPELANDAAGVVRAGVEGAFVANFDPDTYKSDRKDQSVDEITIVTSGAREQLERA